MFFQLQFNFKMFARHLYNIVYSLCYSTYNIFYTCIGLAQKYLILEICFSNVLTNNWLTIQDIRSYISTEYL